MNNCRLDTLQRKKQNGELLVGSSISTSDPMVSEALAYAGLDLLWIDMEHTALDKKEVLSHITAVQGAGCPVFVRVAWNDPVMVKPILDMGPDGIIFPMISTGDDAARAARSIAYPPEGVRGYGPLRANKYGKMPAYLANARKDMLCFVQIETAKGVACIQDICNVPGVDGILFGGMDLSAALGNLGDVDTAAFREAVRIVSETVRKAGLFLGCCAPDDEVSMEIYMKDRVDIYLASGDLAMVTAYAGNMAGILRIRASRASKDTGAEA